MNGKINALAVIDDLVDERLCMRRGGPNDSLCGCWSWKCDACAKANSAREAVVELREAATDYARLIQVENFDRNDIAVHRAYERLRESIANIGADA